MSNTNKKSGSNNNSKVLIAVFAVVIIALAGAVIYLVTRTQEPEVIVMAPTPVPNVLVGMSTEEIEDLWKQQEENAAKNNIIVSMPVRIEFEDSKSEGMIDITNVEQNVFSFTVEYFLDDNTSVLKTGLIAPGYTLQKQKLDVTLQKGEYPASAIYTTYDEEGNEVGKVGVAVTLVIKK